MNLALVAFLPAMQATQEVPSPPQPAAKAVTQGQPAQPVEKAKASQKTPTTKAAKIQKMVPRPKQTPEELTKRYEKMLESPWIAKGHWIVDYDEARARAKREGKLIFVYFSRSYAY